MMSRDYSTTTEGCVKAERIKLRALRASIMKQIDADLARIDRMIRAIDLLDGDPDLEPDADDEDGNDLEDVRHEEEERLQPLIMKGGGFSSGAFS